MHLLIVWTPILTERILFPRKVENIALFCWTSLLRWVSQPVTVLASGETNFKNFVPSAANLDDTFGYRRRFRVFCWRTWAGSKLPDGIVNAHKTTPEQRKI
jgi:hypothetical protein